MSNRARLVSFLLLVSLLAVHLTPPTTLAQDILPPNAFLIRNKGDRTLTFWLRKGSGNWKAYELAQSARDTYEDKDQIWISTIGKEPVHYTLTVGNRYALIWKSGRWDVEPIEL